MNYGLDLEKERREQDGSEWIFSGFSQPSLIYIPQDMRDQYLPTGEAQATNLTDTSGCATRSPINKLAPDFTYGYKNRLFTPSNVKFLEQYIGPDGKIDFSDRFIEILSGTTRAGNSLKAPLQAIRDYGLIPKTMFPLDKSLSFEEYYDRSKITQKMLDLGNEFSRRFTINYEQVQQIHFGELIKDDMICVGGYAWPDPLPNGEYPRVSYPMNHAFLFYKSPKYYIFDNYNYQDPEQDWIKKLASNYALFDYGYHIFISAEHNLELPPPTVQIETLKTRLLAVMQQLVTLLQDKLRNLQQAKGRILQGLKH
jgi:hypothetical protein